jgi:hypothetical protein
MPDIVSGVRVNNFLGLIVLVVLWLVVIECTRILIKLLRREPLLGWAVGPFGITLMCLREPSLLYIWLDVLCPALVSGITLYCGLFTSLSPLSLPRDLWVQVVVIAAGVLFTCTGDILHALRDLRYPLWGEARFLRSIQILRGSWARIHFTPFGYSYVNDRFRSNPTDLLQALL